MVVSLIIRSGLMTQCAMYMYTRKNILGKRGQQKSCDMVPLKKFDVYLISACFMKSQLTRTAVNR